MKMGRDRVVRCNLHDHHQHGVTVGVVDLLKIGALNWICRLGNRSRGAQRQCYKRNNCGSHYLSPAHAANGFHLTFENARRPMTSTLPLKTKKWVRQPRGS
jgi:hypothetical protein